MVAHQIDVNLDLLSTGEWTTHACHSHDAGCFDGADP